MTPLEADVCDYILWMRVHNYADTTIDGRERHLAYFVECCGRSSVFHADAVTFELVQSYQHQLFRHRKRDGRPLSVATQAQRLLPVAQLFAWLRRAGRVQLNPTADIMMPRPDRKLPESTLSASEMALLLAAPDVSPPLGLRDRAMLEVFYSCALRRGELIGLKLGDIDYGRGTVFVRCGKGAKDRYVPIGERALFWLRLYVGLARPRLVGESHPDRVFLSSVGTPFCPDWLSRKIRQYLAQAGISKRGSCHLLRHTVATLMLEGGADIRYVAEMLGHVRLETTQQYTRVSIDRLRTVHAATHPAAGFSVAMASELCTVLPESGMGILRSTR